MHDGGEQIRDWMHVDDHCCAIWTLDEKKVLNDKFNIGGEIGRASCRERV